MSDTDIFLKSLFAEMQTGYALIWTSSKTNKESNWFNNIDNAINFIHRLTPEDQNVYVMAGLSGQDNGPNRREKEENIIAIPGVWADIDYSNEAHAKTNLPPSKSDAISLIEDLNPSIVIHTGHGIQGWWIFDKIWVFSHPEEWKKAKHITRSFHQKILNRALAHGWTVDSVFDLTRIMRVPGTLNIKNKPFVPCEILSINDIRYSLNSFIRDLELPDTPAQLPLTSDNKTDNGTSCKIINISNNSNPIFQNNKEKALNDLSSLTEQLRQEIDNRSTIPDKANFVRQIFDVKFDHAWNEKKDPTRDGSPSSFDFSLAIILAEAGWSSVEIAKAIVHRRRANGHPTKLDEGNYQYYARTCLSAKNIANNIKNFKADKQDNTPNPQTLVAQTTAQTEPANQMISAQAEPASQMIPAQIVSLASAAITPQHIAPAQPPQASSPSTPLPTLQVAPGGNKDARLVTLEHVLGLTIHKIVKYQSDDPEIDIHTSLGLIKIKDMSTLHSLYRFNNVFSGAVNRSISENITQKSWRYYTDAILALAQIIDVGEEGESQRQIAVWLNTYLEDHIPVKDQNDISGAPIDINGVIYFQPDSFFQYIRANNGYACGKKNLCSDLRRIGYDSKTFSLLKNNLKTTRNLWYKK